MSVDIPDASDTAKFEAIAPTLRWMPKFVRENLSAKTVWTVGLAVFGAGSWIAHETGARVALEHANADLKASAAAQVQAIKELTTTVNQINTTVASIKTRVDDIGEQVDTQGRKWERVESAAEIRIPRRNK
jgi:hypothetical protein